MRLVRSNEQTVRHVIMYIITKYRNSSNKLYIYNRLSRKILNQSHTIFGYNRFSVLKAAFSYNSYNITIANASSDSH